MQFEQQVGYPLAVRHDPQTLLGAQQSRQRVLRLPQFGTASQFDGDTVQAPSVQVFWLQKL